MVDTINVSIEAKQPDGGDDGSGDDGSGDDGSGGDMTVLIVVGGIALLILAAAFMGAKQ